jgi:hypothetical protein
MQCVSKPMMLAELELPVTPMSQHEAHPTSDIQENMACWYASALMVLHYRGPQAALALANVHTVARKWKNEGIWPHELWRLAEEAQLEHADARAVLPRLEAADWRQALSKLGPLVVTVGGHAIVVRGIVRQGLDWHIVFNDPMPGARRTMVLPRFNSLLNLSMPILYRRALQRPPVATLQPVARPLDGT